VRLAEFPPAPQIEEEEEEEVKVFAPQAKLYSHNSVTATWTVQ
jgi:hypothetical protein